MKGKRTFEGPGQGKGNGEDAVGTEVDEGALLGRHN